MTKLSARNALVAYLEAATDPNVVREARVQARAQAERWLSSGSLTPPMISELNERPAVDHWLAVDILLDSKVLRRTRRDSARIAAQIPLVGKLACGVAAGTWISKRNWEKQWLPGESKTREELIRRAAESFELWLCKPFASESDLSRDDDTEFLHGSTTVAATSAAALGSAIAIEVGMRNLVREALRAARSGSANASAKALEGLLERAIDFRSVGEGSALPNLRLRDAIVRAVVPVLKIGKSREKKLLLLLSRAPSTLETPQAESWAECFLLIAASSPPDIMRSVLSTRRNSDLILLKERPGAASSNVPQSIVDDVLSGRSLVPKDEARLARLEAGVRPSKAGGPTRFQGASVRALIGMSEGADADVLQALWQSGREQFAPSALVKLLSHVVQGLSSLAEDSRRLALESEWHRLRDLSDGLRTELRSLQRLDHGWASIDGHELSDDIHFRVPKPSRRTTVEAHGSRTVRFSPSIGFRMLAAELLAANERGDTSAPSIEAAVLEGIEAATTEELPLLAQLATESPDFRLCLFRSVFALGSPIAIEGSLLVLSRNAKSLDQWVAVALADAHAGQVFELPDALATPVIEHGDQEVRRLAEALRNPFGSPALQLLYQEVSRDITQARNRVKVVSDHTNRMLTLIEGVLGDVAPRGD